MIGLEIHIEIAPGKRKEFLQTAEDLLRQPSRGESACVDRAIFEKHGAPDHFLWQEDWEDREALDAYLASGDFRTLLGALRVLGETHDLRILSPESAAVAGHSAAPDIGQPATQPGDA